MTLHLDELARIRTGFDPVASRSHSLPAWCYTDPRYLEIERDAVFHRAWQFAGHAEKLAEPGSYFAFEVQGQSLFAVCDRSGALRVSGSSVSRLANTQPADPAPTIT